MFSYLPSLLSGAWQHLPAYAALSGALQRRLLAYLLRRALGRFLAPGALDAASIDAAIGSGSVEIAGLQLSAEAINELLPRGPLRVVSGQLGRVAVQLPFPNLWSGELSLSLSDIDVRVALDGKVSPPASPFDSPRAGRSSAGLEESILGAAESVFHDTLEGQELEESLQASMLAASTAVPGTSAAAAAASEAPAPSSLIAGIVEGLLARLKVSVRRVTLHLQHSQHLSAAAGVQLELRMESFDLQSEASAPAASHPAALQDRLVQEVVRTARVAGISLWMTLPADAASHEARGTRQARWRAASSSESGSSDSDSETNEYMEMSSAIPDLRQSSIATGALDASQASVYASAEDIRGVEVSQTKSRPDASADTQDVDRGPEMLFSLGSEAIVVRFATLKEVPRPAPDNFASQNEEPDAGEAQENETVVALPASRLRTSLSVEVGAVVAFVHPRQLAALMSMAGELGSASSPPRDDEQPTSLPAARAAFDASLRIAALHLICAYESPNQLSPPSKRAMHESLQAFWQRPARIHPAVGHLRLRVEGVELDYAVAASSELSPTACVLVTDVGVYEHLSPHLANGDVATVFPILLPDANMQEQYAVPLAGTPLGLEKRREALAPLEQVSMDAADWRLAASEQRSAPSATSEAPRASSQGPYWRASWGERAWKVRPRARRASSSVSSAAKELLRPAVRVNVVLLVTGASTTVELAPLHVFVDVSTVNRLMPLAQSASAALRQNVWSSARSDMSQSFATLTASPKVKSAPLQGASTSTSASRTELRCALLRVELRVPSAAAGPQASELRSGILIVDVQGIDARLGPPSRDVPPHRSSVGFATGPPHTRARPDAVAEDGRCSIAAVVAFFKPIREARATAFAVVGKLAADEAAGAPRDEPRPLSLCLLRRPGAVFAKPRSSIDVQLPAVRTSLSKALLDQLELLADDLSQWSAALGRETDTDDVDGGTDALKILGSRFFGTKHSISALSGSSDSTELAGRGDSAPALALSISEASVSLHVPRADSTKDLHHLEASASEIALFVDPAHAELTTLIDLSIMDVVVKSRVEEAATTFVSRTLEQSLASGGIAMISLHLLSIAEADTSYRESKIDVALRGFTVAASPSDAALLSDLARFLQSPEGAFEHVEPNEVTRLSLRVRDVSLVVSAPRVSAQAAAVIGELSLKAKLSPYSRRTTYKFALRNTSVLLAERATAPSEERRRKIRTPLDHWAACEFATLVDLADAKGSLTLSTLTRPEVDVKVSRLRIEVTACADTLSVVAELSRALTPVPGPPPSSSDPSDAQAAELRASAADSDSKEPDGRDMLASLDEDAFRRSSQNAVLASSADLVEDDIPRNASYLGAAPASPSIVSAALEDDELLGSGSIETLDIAPSVAQSANVVLQNDVVTVRLLDPRGICPKPNYFTDPLLEPHVAQNSAFASSVRVRIADCDFALRLFAGYDWDATRQAIETEARRVRRRLQKIQQLLDEGQTPDDSVEAITGALFDSIHISLPAAQSELDVGAAMKVMDDELGEQSETASNASTWQPLPSGAGIRAPVHGPASRRRSKLQRSHKSMIDIELRGIEAEFDAFGRTSPTASRLAVNARSLQILDNIPTSTWRTFLTEMLPENRAFRRNDESRMLRVEVHNVRPQLGQSPREEVRVRAKLAPLRLHVDQDALDFFKKFFSFKTPGVEPEPAGAPAPPSGPFIQHAEIFPIRLKLDYKPKRVDYGLLREGKTVELMNFFHFDEAEMTLRHVTLRGLMGWARLFDTLNDIWTPDVKANQLADVLSGIAPVRSLVNVGAGLADLVLLPIEQYQRDGRLARGLQKGAASFAKTTALEAVRLGAKLATGTQVILEQAEHVLGGRMHSAVRAEAIAQPDAADAGSSALDAAERDSLISRYAEQPEDMRDALAQAYAGLSRGLGDAARTILAVPMEVHERSSGAGASRPVIRAVPIAVLRGVAGASEAVSKTLQGLQRELDGAPQLSEDKYKARKPPPRRTE